MQCYCMKTKTILIFMLIFATIEHNEIFCIIVEFTISQLGSDLCVLTEMAQSGSSVFCLVLYKMICLLTIFLKPNET